MSDPFTGFDYGNLRVVMDAVEQSAKVAWTLDEGETIRYGVARHLVKSEDNFGFRDVHADIREAYLRITTREGMEVAYKVSDLMALVPNGAFAIYDWSRPVVDHWTRRYVESDNGVCRCVDCDVLVGTDTESRVVHERRVHAPVVVGPEMMV